MRRTVKFQDYSVHVGPADMALGRDVSFALEVMLRAGKRVLWHERNPATMSHEIRVAGDRVTYREDEDPGDEDDGVTS